jgi:hypothetical protein
VSQEPGAPDTSTTRPLGRDDPNTARRLRGLAVVVAGVAAAAFSFLLTFGSLPLNAKLTLTGACGMVIVFAAAWLLSARWKARIFSAAAIALLSLAAGWMPLSYILNADAIRVDYPRVPSQPAASGAIDVRAGRAAVAFVLNAYVVDQTTPIARFEHHDGPIGTPADVRVGSLTQFDRQVTFNDFTAPQYTRLTYTLAAPGTLVVYLPAVGTVLFREDVHWYTWTIRLYTLALFAIGGYTAWRRSSSL